MSSGQDKLPEQYLHDAAQWYWTIREADVSDDAIDEWQTWLSASPDHRKAFERVESALEVADSIKAPMWPTGEEIVADQYDGLTSIREWQANNVEREIDSAKTVAPGGPSRDSSRIWAIAATLFIAVAIAAIFQLWPQTGSRQQPDYALYQTLPAEHREVVLPDGSTVVLGGKSTISVAYHHDHRVVVLQNGEAYFTVIKDKTRPFRVEASGRDITAVGTAFNVSKQDARVVVTVTDGIVVVAPESRRVNGNIQAFDPSIAQSADTARVEVGQKLVYDDKVVTPISVANVGDAAAWREGVLKYRGEKLRYVVEDIERYIEYRIILGDPAIGEEEITGTVFQNSADTWVYGLPTLFPGVVVSDTPSGVVVNLKSNLNVLDRPTSIIE